ncbi:tetratricopeptide repeat protein [Streptomyces naphthomycinicus]|uniref:tetratricopeptide repeat protein n=1 Tax=Streptomyces naphthomycinicus TaxID=2872625 RepID=UPI001CED5243|nr:tetratricopeptide repeat protein [Streptomyces sp. TML10]
MAGLSFEKKRARQPVGHPAAVAVRVFGTGGASVGGAPIVAAPGEDIQQAVLNHLQRLAISIGAPVRATIQDDLAGCVVPLEVSADGSSRVTGEAIRATVPVPGPPAVAPGTVQVPTGQFGPAPVMDVPVTDAAVLDVPVLDAAVLDVPVLDAAVLDLPVSDAAVSDAAVLDVLVPDVPAVGGPVRAAAFADAQVTHARVPAAPAPLVAVPAESFVSTSTPTPARGFDAVAEEMLGDGPLTETAEGAELLGEPMSRINEAVREGRIDAATELAARTLSEASAVFGPHHAEVLHLRELCAYIAYLAGDPVRAFRLSLDVARQRRQARDGEAAYGNVQSAATAWRAVRDPEEGLRMGRDLIDLWTDLTAEPGPAADDLRPLESARARMVRLTDRAAKAAQA